MANAGLTFIEREADFVVQPLLRATELPSRHGTGPPVQS
jgi:hypothetical protein